MTAAEDRARELLVAIEREAADLSTLRRLHDDIGDAAQRAANATVAVLSLIPYVASDERAVEFLSDVMAELAATVSQLAAVQGSAMTLVRSAQERADALVPTHSVRV